MAENNQTTGLQLHIPGMGQFKDLEFIQSETNPTDLVVKFPDGSEVVFPNYIPLAEAGAPPAITLDDGTVIPGQEIVGLIENLDYDLIAPAAGNDTVGPVTGGGAGFLADPSGPLGDDIGHGPYSGGVHIADNTEPTQVPGYVDDGSGGNSTDRFEPGTPFIVRDNNGDEISDLAGNQLADQNGYSNSFIQPVKVVQTGPDQSATILQTTAPGAGSNADWDGVSIYLYAGETITMSFQSSSDATKTASNYILAIDDPNIDTRDSFDPTEGNDPLRTYTDLNWDYTNSVVPSTTGPLTIGTANPLSDGSTITYTVINEGWHYIGTGFNPSSGAVPTNYYTDITIDGVPPSNSTLDGTSGNNIIVGGNGAETINGLDGNDTLVGRGGNDQLTGGAGDDQFRFVSETDGHDTIYDFNTVVGNNDVINLDALFDALDASTGTVSSRAVTAVSAGGDTELTAIYDGSAVADFSVILDGVGSFNVAALTLSGNLVVDES